MMSSPLSSSAWIGWWWTRRIITKTCFYIPKCAISQDFRRAKRRNPAICSPSAEYMDELTGGHGIVFATGTPVSNSMVELFTMQRYLQYETLRKRDLTNFDAWASVFGETVTAIELAPEGTGYRAQNAVCKILQSAGADEHVPRGGGHQDGGSASFAHADRAL